MKPFENVVGKTLIDIRIDPEDCLTLYTDDGKQERVYAEGECCSEAWFSDLEMFGSMPTIVRSVQLSKDEIVPEHKMDKNRQEEEKVSFITINTNNGHISLTLRNSSNGYYGACIIVEGSRYNKDRPIYPGDCVNEEDYGL